MASVKAKFLDLEGLKQFWNSVKTTQGANIVLAGYTKEGNTGDVSAADTIVQAIAKLENQISNAVSGSVSSFGGQTGAITVDEVGSGNGSVKFSMSGKNLTATVDGLKSAAYTDSSDYAPTSHEHTLSQISDLDEGWDSLLAAAPDVVNNAALAAKADKTEALKSLSGSAVNDSTDTVITINGSMADGSGSMAPVTIKLPKATSANYGTISEGRVTELAQSLVSKLDGSLIFKGTVDGSDNNLPATDYKAGWTYLVAAPSTYAGQTCENGDMIVCVKDYETEAADDDWAVIQTNINGAVTHSAALVANGVVIGADGNGGVKTVPVGTDNDILTYSTERGPIWRPLQNAGESYGLVKSNTKIIFANGVAMSVTADEVANALTIKGLTTGGVLDTGDTFDGSAAVEFDAITFSEINSIFV